MQYTSPSCRERPTACGEIRTEPREACCAHVSPKASCASPESLSSPESFVMLDPDSNPPLLPLKMIRQLTAPLPKIQHQSVAFWIKLQPQSHQSQLRRCEIIRRRKNRWY